MFPGDPLRGQVLLFYAGLVYGLLLAAGLLLALLRWGMRRDVGHAWQSYRGWLCMVPVATLAVLLGREAIIVFFTGVSLLGFREFARASGLDDDGHSTCGVYLGILAAGAVTLMPLPPGRPGWYDL